MMWKSEIFQPILLVLVGGVLGFFSNHINEVRREGREAKRLAYAFKAEIISRKKIGDEFQYIKHIEHIAEDVEKGAKINDGSNVLTVREGREFFPIYRSNLDKIGSLKNPLPEKITTYYDKSTTVIEEIKSFSNKAWQKMQPDNMSSRQKKLVADHLRKIAFLMKDASALGDEVVGEVDRLYPY